MRYQGTVDRLGFPAGQTIILQEPTPISPQELDALRKSRATDLDAAIRESKKQAAAERERFKADNAIRKRHGLPEIPGPDDSRGIEERLLASINAARERVKQKPFKELPPDVRGALGLPPLPPSVAGGNHVLAAVNAIRSAAGLRELTADEIPPKLRNAEIEKLLEQTLALSIDADTNVNRTSRAEAHRLADSLSAWPISDTNPLLADASRRAAKAQPQLKGR